MIKKKFKVNIVNQNNKFTLKYLFWFWNEITTFREENNIGGGFELKERLARGREVGNMKGSDYTDSIETIWPSFDSHDFQSVSINKL